jgi:hypothetical protein
MGEGSRIVVTLVGYPHPDTLDCEQLTFQADGQPRFDVTDCDGTNFGFVVIECTADRCSYGMALDTLSNGIDGLPETMTIILDTDIEHITRQVPLELAARQDESCNGYADVFMTALDQR